ncbi:MAG: hypothetical protein J6V61_01450 [Bacteroidaceae bacterium]|nr:hypothetical protein [Bacteroidaceae bacterium]
MNKLNNEEPRELRKRNGEDVSGEMYDNLNANVDANTNHNDNVDVDENVGKGTVLRDTGESGGYKPVWQNNNNLNDNANGNDDDNDYVNDNDDDNGTGRNYGSILNVIDEYNRLADEEESKAPSEDDRKKIEKANRRRMLIAGIADAANAFHQAYSYARGVKPMTDNKSRSEEARKRERDDWEWMNKNRDRAMNFRAKAAELEKVLRGLQDKDEMMDWRNAEQVRKVKRDEWNQLREQGKLDIDRERLAITKAFNEGRLNKMQHDIAMDELEYQNSLIKNKPKKKVVERDKYDNVISETWTYVDEPADEQPASSNTGQSKGYGYNKTNSGKKSKGTGYDR